MCRIMGVFLLIAIILCIVILIRSRTNYLSCDRSSLTTPSRGRSSEWSPVLTTLRELPPPYSTKPLSSSELLALQRQAMRYRAIAQQTLAPVTESMLSEYGQWQSEDQDNQHQLPCYHDVTPPVMEEQGLTMPRMSPDISQQDEELVYQSDSLSDESESEYARQHLRKYSACDAMLPPSLYQPHYGQKLAKAPRRVMSRSHDGCSLEFTIKPSSRPATPQAKDHSTRHFFRRSNSVSAETQHAMAGQIPCNVHVARQSTPTPPRRNRSWSTSGSEMQALHTPPAAAVGVDFQTDEYPARPHTSMGCLNEPPGYTSPDFSRH